MIDFSVARQAGLSQSELAAVLGVSRVTVNLWVKGKMKPHRYNVDNVRARMALLAAAIKHNLIPKHDRRRTPRHAAISSALQRVQTEILK